MDQEPVDPPDYETIRAALRQARDEEFLGDPPYPLISKQEREDRARRARIPLTATVLGVCLAIIAGLFCMIPLLDRSLWYFFLLFAYMVVGFSLGMYAALAPICRHYGLCCPYCRSTFAPNYYKPKGGYKRWDDDPEGADRCPKCQRRIFLVAEGDGDPHYDW